MDVAYQVGASMREPYEVARWAATGRDARLSDEHPWRDPSLAGGHAGIALLAAYLDRCSPGDGWDRVGHRHLQAALPAAAEIGFLGPSLHGGWSGLMFAADALAGETRRYRNFLVQAEDALVEGARQLALRVSAMPSRIPPPVVDAIMGLSGVVAVLLRRRRPSSEGVLLGAVRALVHAAGTVDGLPRVAAPNNWARPSDQTGSTVELNLGLAHGVPGVIAALALAHRQGVEVDGLAEALAEMVAILRRYRYEDAFGPLWPATVTLVPAAETAPTPSPVRTAWCYGVPGCARALWLAGGTLERPLWKTEALEAILGVFRRPIGERRLGSPTFCHGDAGVIQIGLRFAVETNAAELIAALADELARLVASHDRGTRFGYWRIDSLGRRREDPGLLDGAAGVALVLLAAASDVEPGWDRAFLLA